MRHIGKQVCKQIMIKRLYITLLLATAVWASAAAQMRIWRDTPLHLSGDWRSRLTVFEPEGGNTTGLGVVICPGGSYYWMARNIEGRDVARWLNSHGITAYVLFYRTAQFGHHYPAMIQDLERTMQIIRSTPELRKGVDADKIGVMGFSAGGHLAATLATYYDSPHLDSRGVECAVSLRPAFTAMIYPVVSMDAQIGHEHSRKNLLGKTPSEGMLDSMSLERHVRDDQPPVFIICAEDDPTVDYRNSVRYDEALTDKGIEHKFILYEESGHGFGLSTCKGCNDWTDRFIEWILNLKL